jgi:hypothetical protein
MNAYMNARAWVFIRVLQALIVCAISIGVLIIVADEIGIEEDQIIRSLVSRLPLSPVWSGLDEEEEDGEGDELTGQAAAWTFGGSILTVAFSLLAKAIVRYTPLQAAIKNTINRFNLTQKKYLMPLHYCLSPMAFVFGVTHLLLSSCRSTSLPEWGLGMMAVCVGSGVIMKYQLAPPFLRKGICRLHMNLALFSVLIIVLVAGHIIVT